MDLQELRAATRQEHEATEAAMPLLEPGLTRDAYAGVLRLLLPIVRSWESWSAAHAPARLQPLLPPRRRSSLLQADLQSLQAVEMADEGYRTAAEEIPDGSEDLPWDGAVAEAERKSDPQAAEAGFLGMLYVLEGSTLGGRFLAREVENSLGLVPGRGNAYFEGHGAATGALWREVTAEIAAVPDQYSNLVIGAAKRTFAVFGAALGGGAHLAGQGILSKSGALQTPRGSEAS